MELPIQLDNVNNRVIDDLKKRLTDKSKIAIAAASFSIYAFEALKDELEKVDELRFIFTSPTFVKEKNKKEKRVFYIPRLNRERNLYGSDFEIKLRNQLSQKAIAKECADWIRRKVHFKSNVSNSMMGGFMYVQEPDKQGHTYLPFDDFNTTQLGCERGDNIYTMINVLPSPMAETYLQIFNQQWRDDEHFSDVTQRVLDYVDTVYNENAPEYIYFITLYNIFNEFLEDLSEDVLPNERTGFKNSVIWSKLYNFQRDAALAIINKLEKYNGCILADSVGLGKTFTALAVIKYYENRNKSVLVRVGSVRYDLIGQLVAKTGLTRRTIVAILQGIDPQKTFHQFQLNPEEFIMKSARIINSCKAMSVIEHIEYNKMDGTYDKTVFTENTLRGKLGENAMTSKKSLYDLVVVDSKVEMDFAEALESKDMVEVYTKLPRGFYINTPMGHYNPDWAVVFKEDSGVKHIYFIAETKGSIIEADQRDVEKAKIACA